MTPKHFIVALATAGSLGAAATVGTETRSPSLDAEVVGGQPSVAPPQAQSDGVIDTMDDWIDLVSAGWVSQVQTFVAPDGKPILRSWELGLGSFTGERYTLSLHEWDTSGGSFATSGALWSAGPFTAPPLTFIEFEVGVTVTPGVTYGLVLTWSEEAAGSGVAFIFGNPYPDGYMDFTNNSIFNEWSFGPNTDVEMATRIVFECDSDFGDVNGDNCVTFADILVILATWNNTGDPGIPGDANCDGLVTFADLLLVLSTWGRGAGCP